MTDRVPADVPWACPVRLPDGEDARAILQERSPHRLEREEQPVSLASAERVGSGPEVEADDDGTRWGERADAIQRRRSSGTAFLNEAGPRRFWVGRSRGYAKTDDLAAITLAVCLERL